MSLDGNLASNNPPCGSFRAPIPPTSRMDVATLAAQQGVVPLSDPDVLLGDFWPEDESIDEFIEWLRKSRSESAS